jgi:hypothetical protein
VVFDQFFVSCRTKKINKMARTFRYKLRIADHLKSAVIRNLPELDIKYVESTNELSDCYYDSQQPEPCDAESTGFVSVTLNIGGADITLRSDDEKNEASNLVDLGGSFLYLMLGTGFEVINYSPEQTYLIFIIRKIIAGI